MKQKNINIQVFEDNEGLSYSVNLIFKVNDFTFPIKCFYKINEEVLIILYFLLKYVYNKSFSKEKIKQELLKIYIKDVNFKEVKFYTYVLRVLIKEKKEKYKNLFTKKIQDFLKAFK